MELADLDYELPPELIAQEPAPERTDARLMIVDRARGELAHQHIRELPRLLRPGDLLVLNDARVVPARIAGTRPTGGRIELLLLRALEGDDSQWEALVRGTPRVGEELVLPGGSGRWVASRGGGRWVVALDVGCSVNAWLDRYGQIPLPPYIRRPAGPTEHDRDRYQTVVAANPGAVAAPTAGLHFTVALFAELAAAGIDRTTITLHVGPGTFMPIRDGSLDDFQMDPERYEIPSKAHSAIERARAAGGRIVAVGTTTVRTLEAAALSGSLIAGRGEARLTIRPGHHFRVVDALLTNFHLPRTPLLALVGGLGGWPLVQRAYETAVVERYRFYSYGDAMLVQ